MTFKNSGSRIGLIAAAPLAENNSYKEHSKSIEKSAAIEKIEVKIDIEEEAKERVWFSKMHTAFDEGKIDVAKKIFKEYELDEQNEIELEKNKAFFLYFLFAKGHDNNAIVQLEALAGSSKDEQSKYEILTWISFCYRDSNQPKKEIELWSRAIKEFTADNIVNEVTIRLAIATEIGGDAKGAKNILLKKLRFVKNEFQKARLFSSLAEIEKSLGNKKFAVFCIDKSVEYDANNRDELFSSAYMASEEGFNEISISNYLTLIRIDSDNETALNNLGILAMGAGLKIKAIEKFKEASVHKYTLAMANQGSSLLEAGFADEAEKIAKEAFRLEAPHENVYSLLSSVSEMRKEEDNKWKMITQQAYDKQKIIRCYTEQYYLGSNDSLIGEWVMDNEMIINIELSGKKLNLKWLELTGLLNTGSNQIEVTGKITGATFIGIYKQTNLSENKLSNFHELSADRNVACIGFVSVDGSMLSIVSENSKDNLRICMRRKGVQS